MANTWHALSLAVAFANQKDMIDLFNGSGGGNTRVCRVYRCYQFNGATAAVTGVFVNMQIKRTTDATAGSTVTPVAHDTSNAALNASTTAGTGRTLTPDSVFLFRDYLWSNDELALSGATLDEWEALVPVAEVWNAGYGDSSVQPIVLRPGFGLGIVCNTSTVVSSNDFEIEFTDEAS